MKKLLMTALAAATVAGAVAVPASAQRYGNFQSINSRQENLDRRIEQGVRRGALTRAEARQLRQRFVMLERLENRYRADGLSQWERRDLDRRFDQLSNRVRSERRDDDRRGYGDRRGR